MKNTTQELVAELGLTHYLEGSANKVGDQIRVTVQLIDALQMTIFGLKVMITVMITCFQLKVRLQKK